MQREQCEAGQYEAKQRAGVKGGDELASARINPGNPPRSNHCRHVMRALQQVFFLLCMVP